MIRNAFLISFAAPGTPSPSGDVVYTTTAVGVAIAVITPKSQQLRRLGQQAATADALLIVQRPLMVAGVAVTPVAGWRVVTRLHGGIDQTFDVLQVAKNEKTGGLSNFELYCKGV